MNWEEHLCAMKKYVLYAVFGCLFNNVYAQWAQNFKQHIAYLSADSLMGRYTGSEGEKQAARYIMEQLKKDRIKPLANNNYLQAFTYSVKKDSVRKEEIRGNNVTAFINNHAKHTIVLGAHYDHLGMGDNEHSAYRGEPAVHNGADDNASGVAMVLELADELRQKKYKRYNYAIAFFSGEELGLYGSKWFMEHAGFDSLTANCMLNFDMVGRVDSNKILLSGTGTSSVWKDAIANIVTPLKIKTSESGVGPSDHTSFYLKSIPVLHFFSGQHRDYHKPSDDEEKINYQGMEDIMRYVLQLVEWLNGKPKIDFIKTKDDSHGDTPKFTVTLGVMPDYTYDGEGMRIDGVTDGKPAHKAGLLQGDVVIQLGDIKITDMMSYMKALSAFKKGEQTTVKIKRGDVVIEKQIQF